MLSADDSLQSFERSYRELKRNLEMRYLLRITVCVASTIMEMYIFMLENSKVAVSLMRHGGLIESARLFVGDCTLTP